MNLIAVGLDIAKSIFQLHGVDAHGKSALRKQLRRSEVLRFFAKLAPCLVGIEACHGSHFWGRELSKLGHRVRLLPTQYVKPYLLGGKNDANDAAAICAAAMRPDMHAVAIKDAEQQSLQSLHRMRQRLVLERTAKSNQIRSMFAEEGMVFSVSITHLRRSVAHAIGDPRSAITPILRRLGGMYLEQLSALEGWLSNLNQQLHQIATERDDCKLLTSIPGIGPIVATAFVGTVGDPRQFKNGRQFAAWAGLTPRQRSSGGKTSLGGITKHGDVYLRTMLIQGARAVVRFVSRRSDPQAVWLQRLMQRRHKNVAIVALANKIARVAWAVLTRRTAYSLCQQPC
jgi:transposase